jgi:hypothetical protein
MPKEPPKQEPTDKPFKEWGPPGRRSIRFKDDPTYWQALGRFVETFAGVELLVFTLTCFYAKTPERLGRIILSGQRTDACSGYIRTIMRIEQFPSTLTEELEGVLNKLSEISRGRNFLIHYGSFETSDKGRIISNISRAKSSTSIEEIRASVADLEIMTIDLIKIRSHLTMLRVMPGASFDDRAAQMPILLDAWQYKPEPKEKKDHQSNKQNHLHHTKRKSSVNKKHHRQP